MKVGDLVKPISTQPIYGNTPMDGWLGIVESITAGDWRCYVWWFKSTMPKPTTLYHMIDDIEIISETK